jgi:signal transduction histidine kinase
VQALGTGPYAAVELDEPTRQDLLSLSAVLPPAPEDICERLGREAEHIQRIAEVEYRQGKYHWEQEYLDTLRVPLVYNGTTRLKHLRQSVRALLEHVRDFCHCEYAVFFASVQEGKTVLAPLAGVGIPKPIEDNLPHFNWKKAGLPRENFDAKAWDVANGHQANVKGVRGDNSHYFAQAGCVLPTSLGNRYRGVLVLGPFAEPVNLQEESRFLIESANTVGSFALTELEVRDLEQERRRWKSTATLLTHQLRTALTPITTQIGRAKLLARRIGKDTTTERIVDFLKRAEDLSLQLRDGVRKTLAGHVLQLEAEDLEFEEYPLSVLVANCIEGFVPEAEKRHRQLVVDEKSVELLPEAEVDVARLTIALSNLIENAIKYSYPNTKIYIHAEFHAVGDPNLAYAVIEVDDLGDKIRQEDRESIFDEGTRGLTGVKLGRIPGSGLGLWETRAVVQAHGGEVGVSCKPTSIRRPQGTAYHVVFSVRIPLNQNGTGGRN